VIDNGRRMSKGQSTAEIITGDNFIEQFVVGACDLASVVERLAVCTPTQYGRRVDEHQQLTDCLV